VFEASKGRLKVVGRAGVGVDNVDLAAATEVRGKRPALALQQRQQPMYCHLRVRLQAG
jgi:phosphoglycerate dehydrogenase-like enzyme